jgi:hypothetical protein
MPAFTKIGMAAQSHLLSCYAGVFPAPLNLFKCEVKYCMEAFG